MGADRLKKILTINGGSSSIKFAVFKMAKEPECVLSGKIDRIGLSASTFTFTDKAGESQNLQPSPPSDFGLAVGFLIDWLEKQPGFEQVSCIGHRIVHGMKHTHAEIIGDDLLKELKHISAFDPDHLPSEIEIIHRFKKRYPHLVQVACFDTSFHTNMPRLSKLIPVPRRFDKKGMQRYGFHGISYAYLMEALEIIVGSQRILGRIILAHLGSGASLAAVKNGQSIDTSMGFTPSGGLMMGTRCGDIDPGAAWYMLQSEAMSPQQFNHLINHASGLLGVSETSSDMQDLLRIENKDIRAAEAVGLFCYEVKKWIGAYTAALGGLDIIVFSGGIGENAPEIRSRICEGLQYLGLEISETQNNKNARIISEEGHPVKVYVIPTNEELMIARTTMQLYNEFEIAEIHKNYK